MRRFIGDWFWMVAAAFLFLAALVAPFSAALALGGEEATLLDAYRSGEIIRLHILAESDGESDQRVKLSVRDALLDAFGDVLAEAGEEGFEAVLHTLERELPAMREVACSRARELGFEGEVSAECGLLFLPEKAYGAVTLPAGEYHALRVTLGSGQGRNWWCVLYPRLCLALCGQEEEGGALSWQLPRIWEQWMLFGH